jgi:hypothetical protein
MRNRRWLASAEIDESRIPPEARRGTYPRRSFPGQCFPRALNYTIDNHDFDGLLLVHGKYCERELDHAWAELPGGVVFDGVLQRFYSLDGYYWGARARKVIAYTPFQAARLGSLTKCNGPWTNEERAAAGVSAALGPSDMPLRTWKEGKSTGPAKFVLVGQWKVGTSTRPAMFVLVGQLSDSRTRQYPREDYWVVRLRDPNDRTSVYGCVAKKTDLGNKVFNALKDGKEHKVVVRLDCGTKRGRSDEAAIVGLWYHD